MSFVRRGHASMTLCVSSLVQGSCNLVHFSDLCREQSHLPFLQSWMALRSQGGSARVHDRPYFLPTVFLTFLPSWSLKNVSSHTDRGCRVTSLLRTKNVDTGSGRSKREMFIAQLDGASKAAPPAANMAAARYLPFLQSWMA